MLIRCIVPIGDNVVMRIELLALATLLTLGCAHRHAPAAAGQAPSAGTAEYKGRAIAWDETVDPPRLVIDGRTIAPIHRLGGRSEPRYYAPFIMTYADTASLLEMAHLLIDTGVLHLH